MSVRSGWAAPAVVGLVTFAAYVLTLMPGVAFGDWGEMQVVPHVLGIAHPTGYPTYLLLARLVDFVPLGSVAFRANLLSAAMVSLTCAVVVALALRLGVRPLIAMGTGLTLGFVGTIWQAATVAEVNPLHLLLAALLVYVTVAWEDRPAPASLAIGGLLLGLALGNHLLTLFLAPFLVLAVLWSGRTVLRGRPALIALAAGACLVGLSVYLYIPLAASASPPLAYNHPTDLGAVLWLVSGTQFRGQFDFLSAKGPSEFAASLPDLWRVLSSNGTPFLPLAGLLGLAILVRWRTAFGLACIGVLLAALYFWGSYIRLEHYLLVPWLLLVLGAGVALEWVAAWLDRSRLNPRIPVAWVVGIGALAFALALAAINWQASDRSRDRSGQQYVDAVFGALPANAAILSYWDASTPLWYGQLVEGLRPDVLVVDDTNIVYEGWGSRENRIRSLVCTRPVFILRLDEDQLTDTRRMYRLTPVLSVPVARGAPSMDEFRPIYRVEPLSPGAC
jgi:hypothetical protein